jgi:proteasome accessory factor A
VDSRGLHTDVIKRVLDLWERGLRAVATGDLGLVDREIDWVIKQKLVERYRAKHQLPLSSPRIARLDLAYHDIHRERGLYYLLARRGLVERVTADIEVFHDPARPSAIHLPVVELDRLSGQ